MIQDQSLVASKHLLVETEDKNLADPAVHVHPEHGYGHPKGHRKADADLVRFPNPLASGRHSWQLGNLTNADPPMVHPEHGHGHGHRIADAKLRSLLDKIGEDYLDPVWRLFPLKKSEVPFGWWPRRNRFRQVHHSRRRRPSRRRSIRRRSSRRRRG